MPSSLQTMVRRAVQYRHWRDKISRARLWFQGKQTMTVYKPIAPLANSAVDSAMKMARGEKVDTKDTINNGRKDVPSILQEPIAVDKNNIVSTIVKDGYQSLEKICANVPPAQCPK